MEFPGLLSLKLLIREKMQDHLALKAAAAPLRYFIDELRSASCPRTFAYFLKD